MKTLGVILLILSGAGCHVVEVNPPPLWKAPVVERWRLTEREYGAIEDPWASAGDGNISAASLALFYEPVFRAEPKPVLPPAFPSVSPCLHRIHLRRESPEGMSVGETAQITLEIESFPNTVHLIRIVGAHPSIQILEVRGATPLVGHPGCLASMGAVRVEVRFTSRIAGRGGLEVELLGEIPGGRASAPGESLARRH